jgi:hypothetical protein
MSRCWGSPRRTARSPCRPTPSVRTGFRRANQTRQSRQPRYSGNGLLRCRATGRPGQTRWRMSPSPPPPVREPVSRVKAAGVVDSGLVPTQLRAGHRRRLEIPEQLRARHPRRRRRLEIRAARKAADSKTRRSPRLKKVRTRSRRRRLKPPASRPSTPISSTMHSCSTAAPVADSQHRATTNPGGSAH